MKKRAVGLCLFVMASGVLGSPVVDNVGYTPEVGYAALLGDLVSTGGAPTTVHIYWGETDGGTTSGNWAQTNVLGGPVDEGGVSSDTSGGLTYGVQYHFRCYASNVNGEAWAPVTATFVTAPPETVVLGNGLDAYGYHINNDGLALDLHNNGGMMGGGDPTTFQNFYGHSVLTWGPGNRGLDFDSDADFRAAGLVNQNDNYSTLFTGHFVPPQTGDYGFRNAGDDDRAGIWLDLDRDGVFESSLTGLGDNRSEQLCWETTGWKTKTLTAGLMYRVAFTHREGGGGSRCDFRFQGPGMIEKIINPADPLQDGMWQCPSAIANPEIHNLVVSPDITSSSATFKGVVNYAPDAVFDVTVYWGTSDGGPAVGAWANTNFVGSYTNVPTIDLSIYADGLAGDTRYYYTFVARNVATNLWAQPSATVETLGAPTVDNGAGPESHVGYARLNGEVTIGGQAEVTICWGRSDAGTGSVLDWDHAVSQGTVASEIPFYTDVTNAWYGLGYVYRCYATNAHGDDWSDAADFTILREWLGTNALRHTGYHGHNNENYMDLDNNGGLMALTPSGTTTLTLGPGDRGLDFNSDADFINAGAVSHSDYYANLFLGFFTPPETGTYRFDIVDDDDRCGIWLDLDRDGVLESRAPGLASDNGEQLAWEDRNEKVVDLEAGFDYMFAVTHREAGGGAGIHARFRLPSGDYPNIKPGDPAQAGMWAYPIEPSLRLMLDNLSVSNVTAGAAYLNAELSAPLQRYDVYAYWGRSDYGTNKSAWVADGGSAYVGSYTNVSGEHLTYEATGLDFTTNYYYAFYASNAVDEIWAWPATQFETFGLPTVTNTGATITRFDGRATLNGALTAGGLADIYVCWGAEDMGTGDASAWEHVEFLPTETAQAPFSTRVGGLLYGVPYYYTCFATNSAGSAWSAVTNFITGKGTLYTNAMRHYGYHVSAQADMDLNNNGGMMNGGVPALFPGFYARVLLTAGPGDRGLDFDSDGDFVNSGVVTKYDNYENLFLGYLYAFEDGDYQFRRASDDDQIGIWLDLDQDGVFESSPAGLGSNRGEQLQWDGDAGIKLVTLSAGYYMFAATHREGSGGANMDVQFKAPSMDALTTIRPTTDPAQDGMWFYDSTLNVGITNTGVSGLIAGQADLNGILYGELAVYDVWVYWSTNNGGESKSAWLADGGTNAYMGSFTNVASTSLVHTITGLPPATTYFYSYYASNAAEEIWGEAYEFGSVGPPMVVNGTATNIGVGTASLQGELTVGGEAEIYVCWGTEDAGTNGGMSAWDHVESSGIHQTAIPFGADVSGALYGIPYYYRCYATNEFGTDWADSAATFKTELEIVHVYDGSDAYLVHRGYHVNDDNGLNLHDNGGFMDTNAFPPYGTARLTSGPGGRGLDFNNDGDFLATGVVTQNDYYASLFLGYFTAPESGEYVFDVQGSDDRVGTWLDLDRDGVFESNPTGLGSERGEQLDWDSDRPMTVTLTEDQVYMFAATHREGTAGSSIHVQFQTPSVGLRNINPAEAGQEGLWGYWLEDVWAYGIDNAPVSDLDVGQAQLNAMLRSAGAVYDVTVYWSTNDGGTNAAAWLATGQSAHIGTYSNVVTDLNHTAGGLSAGTTYYYTFHGTNEGSEIWGTPAVRFNAMGPPTVANRGAANLGRGSAMLQGELTSGGAADITICWGESDAGTSSGVGAWEHVVPLGQELELQVFGGDIAGTRYGVEYEYRVFASNALGTAWSDVDSFATLVPRGSWTPAETRVGLWLDADDAGTIRSAGGAVSQWADKSGNGRDATQSAPPSQPASMPGGLNGKHVVTFDGTNHYLNVDLDFLAGQSHSAFIVTKPTAYTDIYGAAVSGAAANSLHVGFRDGPTQYRMNYWGNDWYGTVSANFHAGQGNILNYAWIQGVSKEIFANGSSEGSNANAGTIGTTSGGGRIAQVVNHGYFGGDIAEIVMSTGTLNVDERQLFEGYLAHKWGLESNLPDGHPHKGSMNGSGAMLVGITNIGPANITRTTADLVGVLDATQSVFEVSLYLSTNDNADAAAWVADGDALRLVLGTHTNVMGHSVTGTVGSLVGGVTYFYTMVASNAVTNMWAVPNVSFEADHEPPSPSPMTFAYAPTARTADSIVMTATTATDPAGPVEYAFENVSNGNVRAWSTSTVWTNSGLIEGQTYGYRVQARDALGNETVWSAVAMAVAENDRTPPSPSPMTFAVAPAPVHATAIAMTATTAHDVNGPVEYFFQNTSSGRFRDWGTSPDWTNTGLTRGDTYGFRVKARDAMGNETAWSAVVNATATPVKITVASYVYDGTGQGAGPSSSNANFLDPGNVELTDGVVPATTVFNQAPWVGCQDDLPDDGTSQPQVTFDFGRDRRVESIEVTYLHSTSQAGGTITAPESVLVSISSDGVTYSEPVVFSSEFDSSVGDAIRVATLDVSALAGARYYRLDFRNTSQWAFLAEVAFWEATPPAPPGMLILVR